MKALFTLALLLPFLSLAQSHEPYPEENPYPPTSAEDRWESWNKRLAAEEKSYFQNLEFRNVGPTVMSGRVVDLAVNPANPTEFYVAYATGGLWYTQDNGISFRPLFQSQMGIGIGDIAVRWGEQFTSHEVWLGSGEANSARSHYAGSGIYRSSDGGESWQYLGLSESQHIARVVLHPSDEKTVWIAAMGHLYSPNAERGVYMTSDGGETWERVLGQSEYTGAIDLVLSPSDENVLYAALWESTRRAWNMWENGRQSGIYKSADGGKTWSRVTTEGSGFPADEFVGRIGLDITTGSDGGDVLVAVVDNQRPLPSDNDAGRLVTRDLLRDISTEDFLKLPEDSVNAYLDLYRFPRRYNAKGIFRDIRDGKYSPQDLVKFVETASFVLLNRDIVGAEVYRSTDNGASWERTHDEPIADFVSSYGYYFGQIRINPLNTDELYILGVPLLRSADGGKTWEGIVGYFNDNMPDGSNVHADHHALWLSPSRDGHVINGNDGGVNISYDHGFRWVKCNSPSVAQVYGIQIDNAEPYNVYVGLQDNGSWVGPSDYEYYRGWYGGGEYYWQRYNGGDGMNTQVDKRDNNILISGYQYGAYSRIDRRTGRRTNIQPQHSLGESPYRFNWLSPIDLSEFDQDILYLGGNKVFRSFDQGSNWKAISPDLTLGERVGDVGFGTLTQVIESPHEFGVIYAGSDDGRLHVTKDAGANWQEIGSGLPDNLWVSCVEVSPHDAATVFVALTGYRWDHFKPYVYKSSDYGQTWEAIHANLPLEPVNVIRQDPDKKELLYVGTDAGLYISFDGGKSYMPTSRAELPTVAVYDMQVQQREKELVLGTHGRGVFIAELNEVQQLPEVAPEALYIFPIDSLVHSEGWGGSYYAWAPIQEPTIHATVFTQQSGEATVELKDASGRILRSEEVNLSEGLNYLEIAPALDQTGMRSIKPEGRSASEQGWAVAANGAYYFVSGDYVLSIRVNGREKSSDFRIGKRAERPGR